MGYLSKNGIKNVEISNAGVKEIMETMIKPEILKEPILEAI
jgi:hypothetical protein